MSGFLENDYLASWKDFPRESLKGPGDSLEVGPRMGQEWVTAPSLAADDQAASPGSSLGGGGEIPALQSSLAANGCTSYFFTSNLGSWAFSSSPEAQGPEPRLVC